MKRRAPYPHTVLNFLYAILALLLVFGLALIVWAIIFKQDALQLYDAELPATLVGLLLTGVTLSIASAIIIPRIALRQAVDEAVRASVDEIEAAVREEFEKEAHKRYEIEIRRADAHLSRMVAYFLIEGKQPDVLWGMGWILRSARRYYLLDNTPVDMSSYIDLVEMLAGFTDTATRQLCEASCKAPAEGEETEAFRTAVDDLRRHLTGTGDTASREKVRKVIRYLKDFFDLEVVLSLELEKAKPRVPRWLEWIERVRQPSEKPIVLDRSRYPLLRMMATYQVLTIVFIHVLGQYHASEVRQDLAEEIVKISYTSIWEGLSKKQSLQYKSRLRSIKRKLDDEKSAIGLFAAASRRFESLHRARSEESREDTYEIGFLLNPAEVYKVTFQG